jgi:hypothetical protein
MFTTALKIFNTIAKFYRPYTNIILKNGSRTLDKNTEYIFRANRTIREC